MTIERFAGLTDNQQYTVLIYNETTKKTVKGLKVTGRELQALARALDGLVQQQLMIEGNNEKQEAIRAESIETHSLIPDTGDNPLDNPNQGAIGGYERTYLSPDQPANQSGFNTGGPISVTENPDNQRPPKLP